MKWTVVLTELAEKDLHKVSADAGVRIVRFLHERVADQEDPRAIQNACWAATGRMAFPGR